MTPKTTVEDNKACEMSCLPRSSGLRRRLLSSGGQGRHALGAIASLEDSFGARQNLAQTLLLLRDRRPGLCWRTHV